MSDPDSLKSSIVRPRLKKPTLNTDELTSYRPISNLSFISKTVERLVASRFTQHADAHCLLPSRQSAYRSYRSTETAILAMHDGIVRSIDSGKVSALVLLDLSSAFDTVDHDIMLQVMKTRFNVEGKALDWYRSYLTDRTQTFQVGSTQSGPHIIDCSVPQGSVLGPQEFIAYVEDLSQLIDSYYVDHHQYADDTQIAAHTSIEDVPATVDRLQKCVEAARAWCASRRLQLNSLKTELIWFGTRGSLCKLSNTMTCLRVGGDIIKPAAVVRNLGVLLDREMSMKQHIEQVEPFPLGTTRHDKSPPKQKPSKTKAR